MKLLRLAIVLVLLCWLVSSYAMTPDDLDGGDVVAVGTCSHIGKVYRCVAVEKNNKLYLVILAGNKEIALYSIKELKGDYRPDEMTLLWARDMT